MMTQLQKDLVYVVVVAVALALMIEELVMGWSTQYHRVGLILIPCFTYLLYWRIKPLWKELGHRSDRSHVL